MPYIAIKSYPKDEATKKAVNINKDGKPMAGVPNKKRFITLFLCIALVLPTLSLAADGGIEYPHFMYRMEAGDFGDDFKTTGKRYESPPIIVPYGVTGTQDSYRLIKREANGYVEITVDGYAGGGQYSFETLVNAVEAYFGPDASQFVLKSFDYTEFSPDAKTQETIGNYTFGFILGNNHRGYFITIKRPPVFSDLDGYEEWESDSVMDLLGERVITGMGGGKFAPGESLTRAQFALIFARLIGAHEGEYKGLFPDVLPGAWYCGAVESFAGMGYVKGFDDGSFRPDEAISYQDMFVITHRYLKDKNLLPEGVGTPIRISDLVSVSGYAKLPTDELYSRSLIPYTYLSDVENPATRIHATHFINGVRMYTDITGEP